METCPDAYGSQKLSHLYLLAKLCLAGNKAEPQIAFSQNLTVFHSKAYGL